MIRNIGLVLATVGGTKLAAPIALPIVVSSSAGYLAVAGGFLCQLTTAEENLSRAPNSKS